MEDLNNIQDNETNKQIENDRIQQQQAIAALIQGVIIAQKKGAYSLEEASELNKAVKVFVNHEKSV